MRSGVSEMDRVFLKMDLENGNWGERVGNARLINEWSVHVLKLMMLLNYPSLKYFANQKSFPY